MINLKSINNLNFIHTTNTSNQKTACATYEVFDRSLFNEFIDTLICKEISDIREFEDVEELSDNEILTEFNENFQEFLSLKESVTEDESIVYLHNIENNGIEKGAAREIIEYLKNNYDKVILYSLDEAIEYWLSSGFESVIRDEYYGLNF